MSETMPQNSSSAVAFEGSQLFIDGEPRVLMCASLFPFRVPREQWQQRLEAVKGLGYRAIDVYVPWNFHELEPGVWDFSGQRDIESFLRMTSEVGLFALVRPGPYICSEWDGGALPAWVSTDAKMCIRQNDPSFLKAVRSWYERIIPILARQQYQGPGQGGPVIMVQADNELDFFDCEDPTGYIGALSQMMREMGITVPIIACAGEGDMLRAGGQADGVAPAVNLYPNDADPDFDAQVRYYRRSCDGQRVPMVVTETNRWHRTLRRLVGSGARFIGPYLQASGWNFGYGPSINNWGSLEAFMTHDYDFGGVIDPAGQEREDADDARRLCAMIGALGQRLALADLPGEEEIDRAARSMRLQGQPLSAHDARLGFGILHLQGGGSLLTLTNVSQEALALNLGGPSEGLPNVQLPAGAGLMLVRSLPLSSGCTLRATNGELIGLQADRQGGKLQFSAPTMAPGTVWLALELPEQAQVLASKIQGDLTCTELETDHSSAEKMHPAQTSTPASAGADKAQRLLITGLVGSLKLRFTYQGQEYSYEIELSQPNKTVHQQSAPVCQLQQVGRAEQEPAWKNVTFTTDNGRPQALEGCGIYRGTGLYRAQADARGVVGLVLRQAADILSVNWGSLTTPWQVNGGADCYLPFSSDQRRAAEGRSAEHSENSRSDTSSSKLSIRAAIWGHSNFDDSRLNAFQLTAKRGISGVLAVEQEEPLESGWLVQAVSKWSMDLPGQPAPALTSHLLAGNVPHPRGSFGGWSASYWPRAVTYVYTFSGPDRDAALRIEGGQTRCEVALNDRPVGAITPFQETLWLGSIHQGDQLSVTTWQAWGEETGKPTLLSGREITGWTLQTQGLAELREAGQQAQFAVSSLPLTCQPGQGMWVMVSKNDTITSSYHGSTVVRCEGSGLQLTAFTQDYDLGRLVLGGLPGTTFAGGRGDLFLVPEGQGDLLLYLEATGAEPGHLTAITLGGLVDRS
ncbi:hypothetical protein KIM372_15980 [Bombiscardovia nodaiensis]|uniref:Glycoside hydrolase 35 catalytic domain-containing protein n=1 Tax=Bombiscardovia nodaiensis TaxID=2932181 RepID=A0ABN6SFL5_9BIFI|nr:hypothetical protein KIM372_15980 [Bombiscardovia nodaiensis]